MKAPDHINIEDGTLSLRPDPFDLAPERAIELSGIHFLPFNERAIRDPLAELFDRHEEVILAIHLMRTPTATRGADRERQPNALVDKVPDDRGLASTGWSRNDDAFTGVLHRADQRMFITCSFTFSSSSFISTTSRWMAASLAFDPMVLISRPISCAMKLSLRPCCSSPRMVSTM